MTKLQKLTLRASSIRSRLNELTQKAELTAEQRTESDNLTNEFQDVETRRRAAIVLEGNPATDGGEERALQRLTDRASLGSIFDSILESRSTDGAEKEIQGHYKLNGNQVPLSLFAYSQGEERGGDAGAVLCVGSAASHGSGDFSGDGGEISGRLTSRGGGGQANVPSPQPGRDRDGSGGPMRVSTRVQANSSRIS